MIIHLQKNKKPRILAGHVWAYRSELALPENVVPGTIADLHEASGKFIGRGYVNPRSEISFRLLAREKIEIDQRFFEQKISAALALRERVGLSAGPCRMIFSEGDGLPGFTVDRFANVLVVSLATAGADALRAPFLAALHALFPQDAIYERSQGSGRLREGLAERVGFVFSEVASPITVCFDGIPVTVDFMQGQKNGAYLDARPMRLSLRAHAAGRTVLDCFAHIGLFSSYALAGGAKSVTLVETDAKALALARAHLPPAEIVAENVFDVLKKLESPSPKFDCIVLDPPAFTKNARTVAGALRGYKEINLRALKCLPCGGLLYTSSCSFHVRREIFLETLKHAAADARKTVRVLEMFSAGLDHPHILTIPETEYFKGFLLEVVG